MNTVKINQLQALHDYVVVTDMNFDQKITRAGIILLGDDKRLEGIHPRWAKVFAVGPDQKEIRVGQYVCVAHGRWTRGLEIEVDHQVDIIRRVDPKDILMVSDHPMQDETIGDSL